MTLARGDWFYIVLVALDSFFMARPYLYVIQNDNYRVSEIFKNKHLRLVYALDVITVAVFCGIELTQIKIPFESKNAFDVIKRFIDIMKYLHCGDD